MTLSHLTLNDLERCKVKVIKWSKIDICVVTYCVSVNQRFQLFSMQQQHNYSNIIAINKVKLYVHIRVLRTLYFTLAYPYMIRYI